MAQETARARNLAEEALDAKFEMVGYLVDRLGQRLNGGEDPAYACKTCGVIVLKDSRAMHLAWHGRLDSHRHSRALGTAW